MKKTLFYCLSMFLICASYASCTYNDYYECANKATSDSTSLFVATDRHENGTGNNLTALLQIVSNNLNVMPPRMVLLGGDYVGSGPDKGETGQPVFNLSDVTAEIVSVMGHDKCSSLLTYGSHDKGATEGYSDFFSGPHSCDGYYAYGISFAQMYYDTDSATTANFYDGLDLSDSFGFSAESATLHFSSWIRSLSDNAPIVIMSHVPMHANRNDNPGALRWFNAISKAAKSHDIIMFFGHNHTLEEHGNPADRYDYLLTPGDSIYVQGTDSVIGDTLNFSYANAGYIKLGYSSLVTFVDTDGNGAYDRMNIRRYSLTGEDLDSFGLTGKRNPYSITLSKSR